jgi:protein-tyrosine-phosphatase/DNA-binding transcriptional ArsR family regulator
VTETTVNALGSQHPAPEIFKILADDLRWTLLRVLATGDCRVQELSAWVDQPVNLVSYHLKRLREDRLVTTRRSDADGRDIYYRLDLARLRDLLGAALGGLHPGLGLAAGEPVLPDRDEPLRVLFVCTHNSARSQMAEALLRKLGGRQVVVHSAGSEPSQVHPDAIRTMDAFGIDIRGYEAEPLTRYEQEPFDYVITVCDVAREVCPPFPGDGQHFHWSIPNPSEVEPEADRQAAFMAAAEELQSRLIGFLYGIAR